MVDQRSPAVEESSPLALFDKDFKHFYDTGLECVLPESTMQVFRHLRRLIWRGKYSGSMDLDRLTRSGGLGVLVNRDSLCARTGLVEASIKYALGDLQELGWIKRIITTQQGSLFELGKQASGDNGRIRRTAIGEGAMYMDGFVDRIYEGLHLHAIDKGFQEHGQTPWLVSEMQGGLPWQERVLFCHRYLEEHHPKARRTKMQKPKLKLV